MSQLAERRLEERERRRLEILDAAEAVAAVVGIEAMTMDQVARKARLSRALVYVYFHDKSELLAAICIRALNQLNDLFVEVTSRAVTGITQVHECGKAYVRFAREFPVRFEVLAHFEAHSPGDEHDPCYDELLQTGERPQATLVRALVSGMEDGSIRRDIGSPVLMGFTLWGLMHGIIQLTMHKGGSLQRCGISADDLFEQSFRFALSAMSPPPAGTT
jgi:AcrR family transcriptional regulator